jgi:hypothetical protein
MRASTSNMRQRHVMMSYNWLPSPRWAVHASGGPALMDTGLPGRQLSATGNAAVTYAGSFSLASASFSRSIYIGEINIGNQSDMLNVSWSPRALHRRRLLYSFSGGYQWLRNAAGGVAVEGWSVRPTLAIPVNNSLQLFSQYVFFDQHWGGVATASGLTNIRRHMVIFGLRLNFQANAGVLQANPGMQP